MPKQYENDLAKEMYRSTGDEIRTARCGYSGSNAMPQPDVLVLAPGMSHGLEIKGPIEGDTLSITEEDLEQLAAFENGHVAVYLVVKFQRRRPLVVRYYPRMNAMREAHAEDGSVWDDMSVAERFAALTPEAFNPRVSTSDETGTTRLYIDKPDTQSWPSGYGEDDHETILEEIGVKGGVTV